MAFHLVPTELSNSFLSWMAEKEAEPDETIDELQQYVSEPRLKRTGPVISWWMDTAQRTPFPFPIYYGN